MATQNAQAKETAKKAKSTVRKTAKTARKTATQASRKAESVTTSAAKRFDINANETIKNISNAAERGIDRARDAYSTVRGVTQDTVELFGDTVSTAASGMTDVNLKMLDFAQKNVDAGFANAKKTLKANSVRDAVELQRKFAQDQFKAYREQAKALADLGGKVTRETVQPLQKGLTKNIEKVRSEFRAA